MKTRRRISQVGCDCHPGVQRVPHSSRSEGWGTDTAEAVIPHRVRPPPFPPERMGQPAPSDKIVFADEHRRLPSRDRT